MNRLSMILSVSALLVAGSTAFSDDDDKEKAKAKTAAKTGAPDELIGAYTIVSGEKYGEMEPKERIEGTTVRFAEDGIVVLDKEKKEVYAQTYKIDSSSKPWKITMKSKITPYQQKDGDKEMTAKGLIEKDGDTVKLIYAIPGGEMPTEFKTKEKQLMFVMKNERKTSKSADKD